ncbi:hypothetical protein TNCV_4769631 [Trichonephila clavipes]|nr:hypothetical protein TNCV_4769631 [Trichonephila clavipes]
MAPWPRAPVIPQLVDRKTFRDNRWVRHLSLTSWTTSAASNIIIVKDSIFSKRTISGKNADRPVTTQIGCQKWQQGLKCCVGNLRIFRHDFNPEHW